jgi:hypothetical protein
MGGYIMHRFLIAVTMAAVFFAGCKPSPRTGSVGWGGGTPAGSLAKDIPFTAADGSQTTFHKVRAPIAVVAFVQMPPDQCCWISPKLLNLANQFRDLPVSVAEISQPMGKCPHGPGCMAMCRLGKTQLFAFCDADRIAWKAYGEPKSGTVILIDQRDTVIVTGSLDDLKPVADKAYQMGEALHQKEPDMIYRKMYFE